MRAYVGVTDWEWYDFLRRRGETEVNFWQPSGGRRFGAIPQGAPFLFKTHYSHGNRIVGGGFLSGWVSLPVARAWEFFREGNGCATLDEMKSRIRSYQRPGRASSPEGEVGCVMLRDVRFFSPEAAPDAPPGWAGNIVQGRSYDLASDDGSYVEAVLRRLVDGHAAPGFPEEQAGTVPGDVFGRPREVPVRLGQAAFKALVQEAYGRRCAVTGERIVPVLQSAHIRPVSRDGQNRVDNGLLLRSDVHTLFDQGYLGIHPARRTLMVSPRLRAEWGNGDEFYERQSAQVPIRVPQRGVDRPNSDFLNWHADEVFLAS